MINTATQNQSFIYPSLVNIFEEKERGMSAANIGDNYLCDWRKFVGFVSHERILHLWDENTKSWAPAYLVGEPGPVKPLSEKAGD